MVFLHLVTPANAMILKQVRLRALRDAPTAFSSTYAAESRITDREWIERAQDWSSKKSRTYLAMDAEHPCGIAGSFLDQGDPSRAHLVSMWVAPTHRRLGIGAKLVESIIDWADGQNARTLELIVTSNNDAAINFYKRLGFTFTGKTPRTETILP